MASPPHPDAGLAADLLDRWNALIGRLRPGPGPAADAYGEQLLRRWSEPQRRYHTLRHLDAVLRAVDTLAADAGADTDTVRLAAWFHDAVYAPDRSENEERSARLAERVLAELGLPPERVAQTARLVRLTEEHHPAPGDRSGALLCDADLAVLGGPPGDYAAYAAAVREEYAFVPEPQFRAGRAAVLRQLLALPELFRTPGGIAGYQQRARANLAAELSGLEAAQAAAEQSGAESAEQPD
jgi:predicted metal-dependent HD superfamily phosphohydrolase